MPIPDYQQFLLPLLKFAEDNQVHSMHEAYQIIPDQFGLSQAERSDMLPSGKQFVVNNRIGWARTYLKKAGLIKQPKRGFFQLTERGIEVLKSNPKTIDNNFLMKYPEFQEFRTINNNQDTIANTVDDTFDEKNPEELLEYAYEEITNALAQELLDTIKSSSPSFFEKVVVDLLLKMGYGGSRKDAGQSIGKSGDEGIDGIIKEDRLGLDVIYVQAKRWETVIGRPEIQKFAGALQGQRARKGIFITTSGFTKDALEYVSQIDSKIILIDGETLTKLMIEHLVGVSPISIYEIKKVDSDYFEE
jgi:restriction system protein